MVMKYLVVLPTENSRTDWIVFKKSATGSFIPTAWLFEKEMTCAVIIKTYSPSLQRFSLFQLVVLFIVCFQDPVSLFWNEWHNLIMRPKQELKSVYWSLQVTRSTWWRSAQSPVQSTIYGNYFSGCTDTGNSQGKGRGLSLNFCHSCWQVSGCFLVFAECPALLGLFRPQLEAPFLSAFEDQIQSDFPLMQVIFSILN